MNIIKFTWALLLTAWMSTANATLITELSERDWRSDGDKLLTYDSSTGLEWLDLTVTVDKSILDTEQEEFFVSGEFRWATFSEIDGIFDAVIDGHDNRVSIEPEEIARGIRFIDLFGDTGQPNRNSYSRGFTRGPITTGGDFVYGDAMVRNNLYVVLVEVKGPSVVTYLQSGSLKAPYYGSWLVRSTSVPEPSTVILLLLGLAGLSFARYRRQS